MKQYEKYRQYYRQIVFLYYYVNVCFLPLAGSVLTRGAGETVALFILLAAIGYGILSFRQSHQEKKRKKTEGEGREWQCHFLSFGVVIGICFVMAGQGGEYEWEAPDIQVAEAFLLFFATLTVFAIKIYADYYYEKYLTMYTNQCVSDETIRRFEKNVWASLKGKIKIVGILAGLVFVVTAVAVSTEVEPRISVEKSEQEVGRKSGKKERFKTVLEEKTEHIKEKEEKERSSFMRFLLWLLRRVMQVLIVLFLIVAIVVIAYVLWKRLFRVRLPGRKPSEGRVTVEQEHMDEYISLTPVLRRKHSFPNSANGRIRQLFYRYIRKMARQGINPSLTPRELIREYAQTTDEMEMTNEQRKVARLYEKARYSAVDCTDDEVDQMREMTK